MNAPGPEGPVPDDWSIHPEWYERGIAETNERNRIAHEEWMRRQNEAEERYGYRGNLARFYLRHFMALAVGVLSKKSSARLETRADLNLFAAISAGEKMGKKSCQTVR